MANYSVFHGADAALRDLRKIKGFAPNDFERAQAEETEVEVGECKKVCPKLTGDLAETIRATPPVRKGRVVQTTIVAGDDTVDYALPVHEDLEAVHPNGEAKYIERPLQECAPYFGGRVAKRIDLNKAK